jgi:hypothetical protein
LIKGFNLPLQFDPIDEINRNRDMFLAQKVQKWVLEKLALIAHFLERLRF